MIVAALGATAGRSTAQSFANSAHAVPVSLPGCAVSDPEVRIIDDASDWAAVNDPTLRVFCVRPGDFTSAGTILLEASGAPGRPRVLRYHDPATLQPPHPVRLAASRQAIVRAMVIRGASHWIIDGLTVQGSSGNGLLVRNANELVLNRLLVQDAVQLVTVDGVSQRNVLQNSVIRNARIGPDSDRGCILFSEPGVGQVQAGNRVVQNEIYDCTDGIQLSLPTGATSGGHYVGMEIDANDIYLSPARYTNCRGVFDPKGPCGCAENGIDVKIGGVGATPDQAVSITGNRIWGFRETDHGPKGDDKGRCGGSGSWGDLLALAELSSHVVIRGNQIFDGPRGIALGAGVHHVSVTDNVFHGLDRAYSTNSFVVGIAGPDNEIRRNVFADSDAWIGFSFADIPRTQATCNAVVGARAAAGWPPGGSSVLDYNAYYGTLQGNVAGPHDVVVADESQAPGASLCFWRKRWTAPEQVCIAHGTWAVATTLAETCGTAPSPPGRMAPQAPVLLGP